MLDKTLRELRLSPQAYILLMDNGIKTIGALTTFTETDLKLLKTKYEKYNNTTEKEKIIKEIKENLSIYNLKLGMNSTTKPLITEEKIGENNFPKRIVYRLRQNGILTLGKLSILTESDILKINTFGKGALEIIKDVVDTIDDIELGNAQELMIIRDLSEEDRDYYHKKRRILIDENVEYKKQTKINEDIRIHNQRRKQKLFEIPIYKLGIPQPIFINDALNATTEYTLGKLLTKMIGNRIANVQEVELGLKKLNIPQIHVSMNYSELSDIIVTENKLEEIEQLILSETLKREEESIMRTKMMEELNITKQEILRENIINQNNYLKSQIQEKEKIIKQLENLVKEKERLEEINNKLSSKIEELSKKIGLTVEDKENTSNNEK